MVDDHGNPRYGGLNLADMGNYDYSRGRPAYHGCDSYCQYIKRSQAEDKAAYAALEKHYSLPELDLRDVGPYEMTTLWAWGMGTMRFDESDLLTRELENDPHNQDILDNRRMSDTYCTTPGVTYHDSYSDAGLQNLPLDALAGISHGLSGRPPVDGFLGSYTETITVRSFNPRTSTAVVDFYVDNKSGFESFGHAWTQHGHNTSSGPGATIEEKFFWTKTVQVGEPEPGMVYLAN